MPAPDYKDDLVFKPKMTWEELVEFAKDYGFEYFRGRKDTIIRDGITFNDDGEIGTIFFTGMISSGKTYEQMKAIIENMFNKEKDNGKNS